MPHEKKLITAIAVSLALPSSGGFIADRLHMPPLVGYLLASIAVGPFTSGFVADAQLAPQLAEIGIVYPRQVGKQPWLASARRAAPNLGRHAVDHHAESIGLSNGRPMAIRPSRSTSIAALAVFVEGFATGFAILKSLGIGCRRNDYLAFSN